MDEKLSTSGLFTIIAVAVGLTLLETVGQSLLRKFHLDNKNNNTKTYKMWYLPFIAWLLYGICVYLLLFSYKFGNLGLIEIFWDTGTNTLIPLIGVLIFGENLTNWGWVGVIVATVGGIILGLAQTGRI